MDERNEEERVPEFGQGKPKRNLKRLLLLLSLAAIVLIVAAIAGMHFTSQPSFCSSCHEMNPQVTAWSRHLRIHFVATTTKTRLRSKMHSCYCSDYKYYCSQ